MICLFRGAAFSGRPPYSLSGPTEVRAPEVYRVAVFLGLVVLLGGCRPGAPDIPAARPLDLRTNDGVHVAAWLYAPGRTLREGQAPPGLLFVHRYGADHQSWVPFIRATQAEGYLCLAIDLRGHGASTTTDAGPPLDFRKIAADAWRVAADDLRAGTDALVAAGADPENLAVAGEGLGGTLGLLLARIDPRLQAVVMVAPSLEEHGISAESLLRGAREIPVLLLAAENDAYAAASATALKNTAPGFCELRLYPGAAHGTDLFEASPDAQQQVFGWLGRVIGLAGAK